MNKNEIAIIIPARYASTRLPGKPLIKVNDKPIIQWVYERACKSEYAGKVIVATDNQEIFGTVKNFGGNVSMTSSSHNSGSDRIAEIVRNDKNIKIAVNVQGDEPLIAPESIDAAICGLIENNDTDITTLSRVIEDKEEILNPNVVKVVFDKFFNALYFSRAAVPYERNHDESKIFAHIGLYAYRRESLLRMTELEQTNLEKAESLEQLRALQNGMNIKVFCVDYRPIGIDTEEDLIKFRQLVSCKKI
ncbi:MAG: 3-deoxy-manno-octulosonate cytidylyltransferase [Candidatus Gastranaerophilales bacterium]|nr:3-deoxy-manno-octulosonate cytidylyltransferase [Candidatus Gastranaerophilales bacterium]